MHVAVAYQLHPPPLPFYAHILLLIRLIQNGEEMNYCILL